MLPAPLLGDVAGPGGTVIDCYCTDRSGARVDLGEVICLSVDGRNFLARCEMSLNNPMWRDTGESCLHSLLERFQALAPAGQPGAVDAQI